MRVILLDDIKNIGKRGEIKDIKNGYAMNFLIPQKKVVSATKDSLRQNKLNKLIEEESYKEKLEKSRIEVEKVKGQKIILKTKAQEEKLFGSLSEKDILEALALKDIKLKIGKLVIEKSIKKTGEHKIKVIWPEKVETEFILIVKNED